MPSTIGRYTVRERIAAGGMAEVFDAVSTGAGGFERRVAIKRMIPDRVDDASFARMFLDEARIAAQLHHANIVAVLDYGVLDGQPFQVLEFVDGVDAQQLRRMAEEAGEPMPVELALHIAAEVAVALDYAHGATGADGQPLQIVHRDVTPANVLVSWSGEVKLADFGIALATGRDEKTQDGLTKGKLPYMSPEQATAGNVDWRSDIFALGCTLHALMTGKSPMVGPDAFRQVLNDEPLSLHPEIPEDVRAIVVRATRGERAARHGSAAELAGELSAALRARIDRDPRLALRAWLARVRGDRYPKKQRGASGVAALFDVEILEDSAQPGGRSHRTILTRPATPQAVDAEAPTDRMSSAPTSSDALPALPTRRGTGVAVVLILLALAGGGIAAVATWSGGSRTDAPSASADPRPDPPPDQPANDGTPNAPHQPVDDPAPPETDEAPDPAADGSPLTKRVDRTSRSDRTKRPEGMREEPPPPPPPATATSGRYIRVAGASSIGAVVRIDGRGAGSAPGTFEVGEGSHTVEVVGTDGEPIGRRTVDVTAVHTSPGRAARVIFP